jgi:signal peptidase I
MEIFKKVYYLLFDLIQTLVIAGAIFVVIYAFLFRPYQVNGHSMDPTFQNGEYVLTNLITLRFGTVQRGDIVVFVAPPDKEKDYIKRIIGLPGDRIKVSGGNVYLNGEKLDQSSFLSSDVRTNGGAFLGEGEEVVVPANQYFVMGDNREFSSDSREWGIVTKNALIAKSFLVYWPLNHMRVVKHIPLQ